MAKTHRLRFVDAISASPGTVLDLNDKTVWSTLQFDAPPPELRRSVSSSMLVDGERIGASSYSNRELSIRLKLVAASQDALGTQLQTLARILDSGLSVLEFKRDGATAPVFFRTLRADVEEVAQFISQAATEAVTIKIPAKPFAYGLRVDAVAAATRNNDPAAASNGLFVDVPTVQGDVATEPLIWMSTIIDGKDAWVAVEPDPPGGIYFAQAESATMGTDTTVQANDPLMSGASSNYTRTTFTTATLVRRLDNLTLPAAIPAGDYRIFARIRQSASGAVTFTMRPVLRQSTSDSVNGQTTTIKDPGTATQTVDLGILPIPAGERPDFVGYSSMELPARIPNLGIDAGRTAGTVSLDIDYVVAMPASWRLGMFSEPTGTGGDAWVIDGPQGKQYMTSSASGDSPLNADALYVSPLDLGAITGALPLLFPGVTNRLHMIHPADGNSDSVTVNVSYWPKYLWIRPASS